MRSLDTALDLRRRELSIIPIPRPRRGVPAGRPGDGKVPAIAWKEFQDRLATEDEIRGWFRREQNLAVITGAISGVVAIDADSLDAVRWCTKHFPYTPWQVQTSKGFHLYYAHPGVHVPNRAHLETRDGKLAIDVRGDGGYVITIGSVHASGVEYTPGGDWSRSRDALPRFWTGWLERSRPRQAQRPITACPVGFARHRAARYLAAIPRPEIGAGSDTATFSAACRIVRGFDISEAEAVALLWNWAGARPGWTREWIAEKVAAALRYGTEPVGALR